MVTRKRFLKFYTGDHKRVRDPALPGAFYAVETVVHSKPAAADHHVTEERIVWLLSDPAVRAGLPTMSAVRRWINAKWKMHTSAS
jgi:hypothetical protein